MTVRYASERGAPNALPGALPLDPDGAPTSDPVISAPTSSTSSMLEPDNYTRIQLLIRRYVASIRY